MISAAEARMRRSAFLKSLAVVALGGVVGVRAQAPASLPYTAVHDPEFISAADATFMHDADRLIGITFDKTAKAYPAGILSQHGLVEDRSPDGPIAVTW
jgi:uncharacterized protein DUF3179